MPRRKKLRCVYCGQLKLIDPFPGVCEECKGQGCEGLPISS